MRQLSLRGRVALFAALAIVLPTATLAVLGYVSLRQWEAASERFFFAQARDMALMAAEKIETALRRREDALVGTLQSLLDASGLAGPALDRFAAATPLMARLCVVDREGRRLYPGAWTDEDARRIRGLLAELAPGFWERGGRRYVAAGDEVLVAAVVRLPDGQPGLAAFVRAPAVLRRDILAEALGGLEGPTILAVLDHRGRVVYSRAPVEGAVRLLSVRFGEPLPSWEAVLFQPPGVSAREAVRRQITLFTAAFCLVLIVLVAGLVATYRLVRRETELARLKADFVANVSHDLKTPLSLIRMYGETLDMGRVRDEARRQEYYRVITRESERLSRLIDNVLDFSRIEGGRRRYQMAPTAVEPLVRETLEAFGYPLQQAEFKVETTVAPDLPEVSLDAAAVGQALANLIDNAIKYSGARRVLRVGAEAREGHLLLTVTDEGIGIPPEEHARIFEKFYRVGRSETQGRRGSGVGLALVRHVAEAHGGDVTVESRPGEGSRFTLRLPLRGASA